MLPWGKMEAFTVSSADLAVLPWNENLTWPQLVALQEGELPRNFVTSKPSAQEIAQAVLPWVRTDSWVSPASVEVAALPWNNRTVESQLAEAAELPWKRAPVTPVTADIAEAILPWGRPASSARPSAETALLPWDKDLTAAGPVDVSAAELPRNFVQIPSATGDVSQAALPWATQGSPSSPAHTNLAALPWNTAVLDIQPVDRAELPWNWMSSGERVPTDVSQATTPWEWRGPSVLSSVVALAILPWGRQISSADITAGEPAVVGGAELPRTFAQIEPATSEVAPAVLPWTAPGSSVSPASAELAALPWTKGVSAAPPAYVARAELPWDLYLGIERDSSL